MISAEAASENISMAASAMKNDFAPDRAVFCLVNTGYIGCLVFWRETFIDGSVIRVVEYAALH